MRGRGNIYSLITNMLLLGIHNVAVLLTNMCLWICQHVVLRHLVLNFYYQINIFNVTYHLLTVTVISYENTICNSDKDLVLQFV